MSQRAIERRKKQGIPLDSGDLPVNKSYLQSLSAYGKIKYSSKWQNSALLIADDSLKLEAVKTLPEVKNVEYLGPAAKKKRKKTHETKGRYEPVLDSLPRYGLTRNQLDLIGLTPLHHAGYDGAGILTAVLDAGFSNADKMNAFSSLRDRKGIVYTKDFVNPGNDVFKEHNHGTNVLSTMAGIVTGEYFGSSTGADFLLLRTEKVSSEYPVEEYYWLAAAEFADSAGADIITSSLSYTTFDDSTLNHSKQMLDGRSTIISLAALEAFKKGIVVTVSAGNYGNNPWHKIGFPADAPGVISVGAVDSLGAYASFSSTGYTADQRVKPDIAAVGKDAALISSGGNIFYGNGTSFSAPIIAGALACLMQANPDASAADIRQAVIESARHYSHPDSLTGYGIPDFFIANMLLKGVPEESTPGKRMSFKVLPNPFASGFYIVLRPSDSTPVEISLWDLSGKMLWNSDFHLKRGTSAYYIGAGKNLSNGIYFLRVNNGGKVYTEKLIKQQ